MAVDPRVRVLDYPMTSGTDTREVLAHATRQIQTQGLEDLFIVDVDSPRDPTRHWTEVVAYYEDDIMRHNSNYQRNNQTQYVNETFVYGHDNHDMFGRIPHHGFNSEKVEDDGALRLLTLCRRSMEALGVDVQVVFPSSLINLGRSPLADGEAGVAYAYDRWFSEHVCTQEPRIKFMPYLPLRRPEMCERIVSELAGKPGVIGFLVTSLRYDHVQDNRYMDLYAQIQDLGYPLAFHAGPSWEEPWMRTMKRFVAVDAISPVHSNTVHMTNWVMNGLPERFPNLKTIWMQGGLAWLPFLMQRLDSEFMKRTSEAPLLTRLPSEYMREMYYTSQPLERENLRLLEITMEEIHAETQLLYASDWPQWDFDLPSAIYDLPFLSEQAKRNILGENARKLFNLQ